MRLLLLPALLMGRHTSATNPLLKVLELLQDYAAKLVRDGEAEEKAMRAYVEYCSDMAKENDFETKTLSMQVSKLTATLEKLTGDIETADSKISELAAEIATDSQRLKEATAVRDQE